MKSSKEIRKMLFTEFSERIKFVNLNSGMVNQYYNNQLGDTSFLLSNFIFETLKLKHHEWNGLWADDSLITNVSLKDSNKFKIEGVLILGELQSDEQWVTPFYIKGKLGVSDFETIVLGVGDKEKPQITYNNFCDNRNFWNLNEIDWKTSYLEN